MVCEVRNGMFVCRRSITHCQHPGCRKPIAVLCDFPLFNGETCDRALYKEHTIRVADNVDYCLDHKCTTKI